MTFFSQKLLRFTFTLAEGATFGQTGTNRVVLSGLRASAKILKPGLPGSNHAQVRIYGMDIGTMNRLSTLGVVVTLAPKNQIIIEAGDASGNFAVVFQGTIQTAWPDLNASPDVPLHVEAYTTYSEAIIPLKPSSYPQGADVVTVLSGIATQINYSLENNGVSGLQLPSLYLWGSPKAQIQQIKDAMKFKMGIALDDSVTANGTIAIWPLPRGGRTSGSIPLINKDTGMVGYPSYTVAGIAVRTIFNPNIKFQGRVKVESAVVTMKPANGIFQVQGMTHDLDTQIPSGNWFTEFIAYDPARVIPPQTSQG